MSKPRLRTTPDLSLNSLPHQQALLQDQDFDLWSRNVIDEFKDVPTEQIKQRLQATAFPYVVVAEMWRSDFNQATLIRNANAFNARAVYYLGDKRYDRRGSQGCHNYMNIHWLPTIDDFRKVKHDFFVVGCDNVPGASSLHSYHFPQNRPVMLVFGSEGLGLTKEMQQMCDAMVEIEMFGSIRSLNCGTASGLIMYELVRQMKGWR